MRRPPPRSPLFPTPPLFRWGAPPAAGPGRLVLAAARQRGAAAGAPRGGAGAGDGAAPPRVGGGPALRDGARAALGRARLAGDRKSTRLNSSHANISYAVFCL